MRKTPSEPSLSTEELTNLSIASDYLRGLEGSDLLHKALLDLVESCSGM